MKALHMVSWVLLVVGGLNWGVYGVTNMNTNLVNKIFGSMSWLEMLIYTLVGLAAVVEIVTHKKNCACCNNPGMNKPTM